MTIPCQTLNKEGVTTIRQEYMISAILTWKRQAPTICWMKIQSSPYGNIWYKRDAAKTGMINSFDNYPQKNKRLNKAIGGKNGKMPWFFQHSKNGRRQAKPKDKCCKPNTSTMNRICAYFDNVGRINMSNVEVPPFNWQMLLKEKTFDYNAQAVQLFCIMDDGNISNEILARTTSVSGSQNYAIGKYDFVKEQIENTLIDKFGSLQNVYPSIVKHLFTGTNVDKISHKRMFWRIFGSMAFNILCENMKTYSICENCHAKIPSWAKTHICSKTTKGYFECSDCGTWCQRLNNRQYRCSSCQERYNKINVMKHHRVYNSRKKVK